MVTKVFVASVIVLLGLVLVSCSRSQKMSPAEQSQKYLEDAGKARKSGPLEGDIRVMDGVEYVYGKNPKYMNTPQEPLYVWMRRDQYQPSLIDTIPGRVGDPTRNKERSKLEERLTKLEAAMGGGSTSSRPPEQPMKDESGGTWTLYFRNDDGLKWYINEGELTRPSGNLIRMPRKMVFPAWAFQKEIVTLDELDCREAQYRTLELQATGWDGKTQSSGKATSWTHIFSNSPEDYLMGQYCK